MARDADTIQAEIERARDALAVTVDQLTYRANPKRVVERGKLTLRSTLADPRGQGGPGRGRCAGRRGDRAALVPLIGGPV